MIKLLGKRLLLKPVKKEVLGLEQIEHYEVAHIGSELEGFKVGDRIHYQMGVRVNILGEDYQLVEDKEIIAIL